MVSEEVFLSQLGLLLAVADGLILIAFSEYVLACLALVLACLALLLISLALMRFPVLPRHVVLLGGRSGWRPWLEGQIEHSFILFVVVLLRIFMTFKFVLVLFVLK